MDELRLNLEWESISESGSPRCLLDEYESPHCSSVGHESPYCAASDLESLNLEKCCTCKYINDSWLKISIWEGKFLETISDSICRDVIFLSNIKANPTQSKLLGTGYICKKCFSKNTCLVSKHILMNIPSELIPTEVGSQYAIYYTGFDGLEHLDTAFEVTK